LEQWQTIREEKKIFSEEACNDAFLDKLQLDAIIS